MRLIIKIENKRAGVIAQRHKYLPGKHKVLLPKNKIENKRPGVGGCSSMGEHFVACARPWVQYPIQGKRKAVEVTFTRAPTFNKEHPEEGESRQEYEKTGKRVLGIWKPESPTNSRLGLLQRYVIV